MSDSKQITSTQTNRNYEYQLNDKLGSGSFAEVYKGITKDTDEVIAVKVISKPGIKKYGPDILKAIGNEVKILQLISKEINTPYIVKIFDCFETQNNIYIVLEYCNQGTLADILKSSKTLPEFEALKIMYQVVLALEILALKGIAHRDIKPENIFINYGVFKLGDFGFASQKKLFQTTLGTYPYMAPEIFQNKDYSEKVDVWAVGVMLHETLFGELYFIGNSHLEVANNVMNKKYIIKNPENLSDDIKDVLYKCLEKDPNKRLDASNLRNHNAFKEINKLFYEMKPASKIEVMSIKVNNEEQIFNKIMNLRTGIYILVNLVDKLVKNMIPNQFGAFYLAKFGMDFLVKLMNSLQKKEIPGELIKNIVSEQWKSFCQNQLYNQCCSILIQDLKNVSDRIDYLINDITKFVNQNWESMKQLILSVIVKESINIEPLYTKELEMLINNYKESGLKFKNKEYLIIAYDLKRAQNLKQLFQNVDLNVYDFNLEENRKNELNIEQLSCIIN